VAAGADDSDATLVERANRGDADAFEALYRRHRDWVVAVARRFGGNDEDALDVLQDTFAHLFGRFPGFELTAALRTFLYPVVKHLSLDRRRRRRPEVDIDTVLEDLPQPENPAGGEAAALSRALADVPGPQREVVLLRFVDDLSLEQIAAAVDVPVGTVKSRLHHALRALRERLRR
jgi:RNA polymerase sigma-70 factor (ECF subfamily)